MNYLYKWSAVKFWTPQEVWELWFPKGVILGGGGGVLMSGHPVEFDQLCVALYQNHGAGAIKSDCFISKGRSKHISYRVA